MLREKLKELTNNDLCVIIGGRFYNMPSTRIAKDLGVSRERIRQIKNRVNDKLNKLIFISGNTKRLCKRRDCKVWFVSKHSKGQFCSENCRLVHHNRKHRWAKLEDTFMKLVCDIKKATPPFEINGI